MCLLQLLRSVYRGAGKRTRRSGGTELSLTTDSVITPPLLRGKDCVDIRSGTVAANLKIRFG